ncbi:MAG: biotin/lipoyl-binding protein [Clostridiales Family XIII bacterium]|jgi:glutaconyl-CoA decarboxylase|nr:biotin/lipoyl-binding protein [Clostridiales Family XIII bacterium]
MKKYNVTVNGASYQVEVEEAGGMHAALQAVHPQHQPAAPAQFKAPPAVQPAQAAKPAKPAQPAKQPVSAGEGLILVDSPMPGRILSVWVEPGQDIRDGEPLLVLEAMKMENEIYSPADGVVESVMVNKGDSVNSGDILVTIK